jgi:mono/diheme cytochrome c family protein
MRYFILIFVVCVVAVVFIAGPRGRHSQKPPIYVFPDMKRQLKLRPQTPNEFFANGTSSQLPPAGTVARARPLQVGDRLVYPFEDSPVYSGRVAGTTNFAEVNPYPMTAQLLKRGQERFNIYCSPCHGRLGDGMGITKKLGAMSTVKSLHDPAVVKLPDGEIFFVITNGRNTMGPYGPNVPVEDRWAIIAYVRALQLSHLASVDDVPAALRGNLKK